MDETKPLDTALQPYHWKIRVYWEDTDAGGVVYYANYLKFFERARTEWLRSLGFEQSAMRLEYGGVFVVRRCEVDYQRSARLDDVLDVETRIAAVGGASLTMVQTAHCAGHVLCRAKVIIVWVDAQAWRPKKIPSLLFEAIF